MNSITAYQLAIIAAGLFFFNALLTGVWKYLEIAASDEARAHPYVDIAHRTSLLYSFAALLIATFVEISQLPEPIEFLATSVLLLYFAIAIGRYMLQGFKKKTANQFIDARSELCLDTAPPVIYTETRCWFRACRR